MIRIGSGLRCSACGVWRHRHRSKEWASVSCAASASSVVMAPLDPPTLLADLGSAAEPSSEAARWGSRAQRRELVRGRATALRAVHQESSVTRSRALERAIEQVPRSSPQSGNASRPCLPAWIDGLHPSHRLCFVGGFAVCRLCGSVSSREGKRGLLSGGCRQSMPPGSVGRATRLLSGRLPGQCAEWPDGAGGKDFVRKCYKLQFSQGAWGYSG